MLQQDDGLEYPQARMR